ncbi:MAG: hypothetical protein QG622_233 [Actinomycetota bacterium]|nr:hypothetical protein [Actinomycetota bacterium]
MFERFTRPAREVVVRAQREAHGLGHGRIGSPHLLLGLLSGSAPCGAVEVLSGCGVTAEAVRREFTALLDEFPRIADDDEAALAALGIDLGKIREAVEAGFGPGALDRVPDGARRPRGLLGRVLSGWRRGPVDEVALLRACGSPRGAHVPFSPGAKKALELSLREALRLGDRSIDVDHLLLGLLRAGDTAAAVIFSRLGVALGDVRIALEAHHRRSA